MANQKRQVDVPSKHEGSCPSKEEYPRRESPTQLSAWQDRPTPRPGHCYARFEASGSNQCAQVDEIEIDKLIDCVWNHLL
jgi:hypothetical protein